MASKYQKRLKRRDRKGKFYRSEFDRRLNTGIKRETSITSKGARKR